MSLDGGGFVSTWDRRLSRFGGVESEVVLFLLPPDPMICNILVTLKQTQD